MKKPHSGGNSITVKAGLSESPLTDGGTPVMDVHLKSNAKGP